MERALTSSKTRLLSILLQTQAVFCRASLPQLTTSACGKAPALCTGVQSNRKQQAFESRDLQIVTRKESI